MVNWKRVGFITALTTLIYSSCAVSTVKSDDRNRLSVPAFFSGHYESSDPDEEGIQSIVGARERIYSDAVLFDIWSSFKGNANVYYSSPAIRFPQRPSLVDIAPAAVEIHFHGKDIGCFVQYSRQNSFADKSRRLGYFIDTALHINLVRCKGIEESMNSYTLNYARAPAVIVNCGNITKENGHEWVTDDYNRKLVAKSIAEGVRNYLDK